MNQHVSSQTTTRREKPPLRFLLIGMGLLGAGMFVGSEVTRPSVALGEVRSAAPPQHFLSGGQLSVPLLQEIAASLQQIDARLARMEAMAKQLQTKRASSPTQ